MPPAARISDMHTCPMVTPGVPPIPHVGGPVIVGCPTVMIGFMPAARVSDTCICVGPPDLIAKGSMTVFIGGMPAARMGDLTMHGGVIVMGCPTVMIGDVGVGCGGGAPGGLSEADAIAMSKMAYEGKEGDLPYMGSDGETWTITHVYNDILSGFRAVELKGSNGHVVLAFAGTNPLSPADLLTDAAQAVGSIPVQYVKAAALTAQLKMKYGSNLTLTGHSLGGGLANFGGAMTGTPGVGINSAPLGSGTRLAIGLMGPVGGSDNFVHYNNDEFVSQSPGKQLGTIATHENPPGVGYFSGHSLEKVDSSQPLTVKGPLSDEVLLAHAETPPVPSAAEPGQ